jgi:outer membrane protein assembly factor BamD (BamD/ComL family)
VAKTDQEKQARYNSINNLSNILWSKFQQPVSKYKKLSTAQIQYMYEQLMNTDRGIKEIYADTLGLQILN